MIYNFKAGRDEPLEFQHEIEGEVCSLKLIWHNFTQRTILDIKDSSGRIVYRRALVESPEKENINMLAGFSLAVLYYRNGQLVIEP